MDIRYVSEPNVTYTIGNIEEAIKEEKVKISTYNDIDQFFEIGAKVKIKTVKADKDGVKTKKELWYTAEVQDSSVDDDEIVVEFTCSPGKTEAIEVTPFYCIGKIRMVNSVY